MAAKKQPPKKAVPGKPAPKKGAKPDMKKDGKKPPYGKGKGK